MSKLNALTLSLLFVAGLSGCASAPDMQEAQSGFLTSYDKLQPVEDDDSALRYRKSDLDVSKYEKIVFQPSELALSDALKQESTLTMDEQVTLGEYFATRLEQEIGSEIQLKGEGRTVNVRGAFTGITNESEALKIYQYIPVALIVNGIKEAAGKRDKVPVMFVEFEATDSESGEVLLQAMRRVELDEISADQLEEQGVDAIKPKIDATILAFSENLATTIQ